jgi:class 3 adenylate cyclase
MAFSYYLFHVVNRSENSLSQERKKSDRLLLNILPASIAARLKQADEVIADYFKDASVLFADIVDFTKLSEQLEPGEVVHLLNEVLSDFDRLAAEFGLEKIKTIGDAYMVAGGIPLPSDSHLQNLADFALQLQAHFKESSEALHNGLRIRMGMNVGPAVAGVIGKRKFIYDIWGDTINVASRMESNGVAGMIQVTEAVYGRLKQCYSLDFRDVINIKGKGNMKTYFLLAKNTPTEAV